MLTRLLSCVFLLGLVSAPVRADSAFIEIFDGTLDRQTWHIGDYTHRGKWIDTRWNPSRVSFTETGQLRLLLGPDYRTEKRFASGEVRRRPTTHYGRYEAILKAARGEGLNTGFFVYTGPWRDDPKDEIDFEFLGKDPTSVSINTFVSGESMPSRDVALGFDSTTGPNLYAFEWSPDAIRWYANGMLLFERTIQDGPLPVTPGQVYLNLWAGAGGSWMGYPDPDIEAEAQFYCVSFVPAGETARSCADMMPAFTK